MVAFPLQISAACVKPRSASLNMQMLTFPRKQKKTDISLLLKAPRLQGSQASACLLSSCSPSSDAGQLGPQRCVCACERLSVWVCERRNMQRGNKKGVWEGCGENTTTSCPAAQAAAGSDFRPHVSPECDL